MIYTLCWCLSKNAACCKSISYFPVHYIAFCCRFWMTVLLAINPNVRSTHFTMEGLWHLYNVRALNVEYCAMFGFSSYIVVYFVKLPLTWVLTISCIRIVAHSLSSRFIWQIYKKDLLILCEYILILLYDMVWKYPRYFNGKLGWWFCYSIVFNVVTIMCRHFKRFYSAVLLSLKNHQNRNMNMDVMAAHLSFDVIYMS